MGCEHSLTGADDVSVVMALQTGDSIVRNEARSTIGTIVSALGLQK